MCTLIEHILPRWMCLVSEVIPSRTPCCALCPETATSFIRTMEEYLQSVDNSSLQASYYKQFGL